MAPIQTTTRDLADVFLMEDTLKHNIGDDTHVREKLFALLAIDTYNVDVETMSIQEIKDTIERSKNYDDKFEEPLLKTLKNWIIDDYHIPHEFIKKAFDASEREPFESLSRFIHELIDEQLFDIYTTEKSTFVYAWEHNNLFLLNDIIEKRKREGGSAFDYIGGFGYTNEEEDRTLLIDAVTEENALHTRLLIDNGADIEAVDENNDFVFVKAIITDNISLINVVLDYVVDINQDWSHYGTLLQAAVSHDNENTVRRLLAVKGIDVNLAYGYYAHAPLISAFITNDVNNMDLEVAESIDDIRGEDKNNKEVIKMLINAEGIDLGVVSPHTKNTALHLAVNFLYIDIVKLLLDAGADVNKVNKDNNTPLEIAYRLGVRATAIAELIEEHEIRKEQRGTKRKNELSSLEKIINDTHIRHSKNFVANLDIRARHL